MGWRRCSPPVTLFVWYSALPEKPKRLPKCSQLALSAVPEAAVLPGWGVGRSQSVLGLKAGRKEARKDALAPRPGQWPSSVRPHASGRGSAPRLWGPIGILGLSEAQAVHGG